MSSSDWSGVNDDADVDDFADRAGRFARVMPLRLPASRGNVRVHGVHGGWHRPDGAPRALDRLKHLRDHLEQLEQLYETHEHMAVAETRERLVEATLTISLTLLRHCVQRTAFVAAVRALACQYIPATSARLLEVLRRPSSQDVAFVLADGRVVAVSNSVDAGIAGKVLLAATAHGRRTAGDSSESGDAADDALTWVHAHAQHIVAPDATGAFLAIFAPPFRQLQAFDGGVDIGGSFDNDGEYLLVTAAISDDRVQGVLEALVGSDWDVTLVQALSVLLGTALECRRQVFRPSHATLRANITTRSSVWQPAVGSTPVLTVQADQHNTIQLFGAEAVKPEHDIAVLEALAGPIGELCQQKAYLERQKCLSEDLLHALRWLWSQLPLVRTVRDVRLALEDALEQFSSASSCRVRILVRNETRGHYEAVYTSDSDGSGEFAMLHEVLRSGEPLAVQGLHVTVVPIMTPHADASAGRDDVVGAMLMDLDMDEVTQTCLQTAFEAFASQSMVRIRFCQHLHDYRHRITELDAEAQTLAKEIGEREWLDDLIVSLLSALDVEELVKQFERSWDDVGSGRWNKQALYVVEVGADAAAAWTSRDGERMELDGDTTQRLLRLWQSDMIVDGFEIDGLSGCAVPIQGISDPSSSRVVAAFWFANDSDYKRFKTSACCRLLQSTLESLVSAHWHRQRQELAQVESAHTRQETEDAWWSRWQHFLIVMDPFSSTWRATATDAIEQLLSTRMHVDVVMHDSDDEADRRVVFALEAQHVDIDLVLRALRLKHGHMLSSCVWFPIRRRETEARNAAGGFVVLSWDKSDDETPSEKVERMAGMAVSMVSLCVEFDNRQREWRYELEEAREQICAVATERDEARDDLKVAQTSVSELRELRELLLAALECPPVVSPQVQWTDEGNWVLTFLQVRDGCLQFKGTSSQLETVAVDESWLNDATLQQHVAPFGSLPASLVDAIARIHGCAVGVIFTLPVLSPARRGELQVIGAIVGAMTTTARESTELCDRMIAYGHVWKLVLQHQMEWEVMNTAIDHANRSKHQLETSSNGLLHENKFWAFISSLLWELANTDDDEKQVMLVQRHRQQLQTEVVTLLKSCCGCPDVQLHLICPGETNDSVLSSFLDADGDAEMGTSRFLGKLNTAAEASCVGILHVEWQNCPGSLEIVEQVCRLALKSLQLLVLVDNRQRLAKQRTSELRAQLLAVSSQCSQFSTAVATAQDRHQQWKNHAAYFAAVAGLTAQAVAGEIGAAAAVERTMELAQRQLEAHLWIPSTSSVDRVWTLTNGVRISQSPQALTQSQESIHVKAIVDSNQSTIGYWSSRSDDGIDQVVGFLSSCFALLQSIERSNALSAALNAAEDARQTDVARWNARQRQERVTTAMFADFVVAALSSHIGDSDKPVALLAAHALTKEVKRTAKAECLSAFFARRGLNGWSECASGVQVSADCGRALDRILQKGNVTVCLERLSIENPPLSAMEEPTSDASEVAAAISRVAQSCWRVTQSLDASTHTLIACAAPGESVSLLTVLLIESSGRELVDEDVERLISSARHHGSVSMLVEDIDRERSQLKQQHQDLARELDRCTCESEYTKSALEQQQKALALSFALLTSVHGAQPFLVECGASVRDLFANVIDFVDLDIQLNDDSTTRSVATSDHGDTILMQSCDSQRCCLHVSLCQRASNQVLGTIRLIINSASVDLSSTMRLLLKECSQVVSVAVAWWTSRRDSDTAQSTHAHALECVDREKQALEVNCLELSSRLQQTHGLLDESAARLAASRAAMSSMQRLSQALITVDEPEAAICSLSESLIGIDGIAGVWVYDKTSGPPTIRHKACNDAALDSDVLHHDVQRALSAVLTDSQSRFVALASSSATAYVQVLAKPSNVMPGLALVCLVCDTQSETKSLVDFAVQLTADRVRLLQLQRETHRVQISVAERDTAMTNALHNAQTENAGLMTALAAHRRLTSGFSAELLALCGPPPVQDAETPTLPMAQLAFYWRGLVDVVSRRLRAAFPPSDHSTEGACYLHGVVSLTNDERCFYSFNVSPREPKKLLHTLSFTAVAQSKDLEGVWSAFQNKTVTLMNGSDSGWCIPLVSRQWNTTTAALSDEVIGLIEWRTSHQLTRTTKELLQDFADDVVAYVSMMNDAVANKIATQQQQQQQQNSAAPTAVTMASPMALASPHRRKQQTISRSLDSDVVPSPLRPLGLTRSGRTSSSTAWTNARNPRRGVSLSAIVDSIDDEAAVAQHHKLNNVSAGLVELLLKVQDTRSLEELRSMLTQNLTKVWHMAEDPRKEAITDVHLLVPDAFVATDSNKSDREVMLAKLWRYAGGGSKRPQDDETTSFHEWSSPDPSDPSRVLCFLAFAIDTTTATDSAESASGADALAATCALVLTLTTDTQPSAVFDDLDWSFYLPQVTRGIAGQLRRYQETQKQLAQFDDGIADLLQASTEQVAESESKCAKLAQRLRRGDAFLDLLASVHQAPDVSSLLSLVAKQLKQLLKVNHVDVVLAGATSSLECNDKIVGGATEHEAVDNVMRLRILAPGQAVRVLGWCVAHMGAASAHLSSRMHSQLKRYMAEVGMALHRAGLEAEVTHLDEQVAKTVEELRDRSEQLDAERRAHKNTHSEASQWREHARTYDALVTEHQQLTLELEQQRRKLEAVQHELQDKALKLAETEAVVQAQQKDLEAAARVADELERVTEANNALMTQGKKLDKKILKQRLQLRQLASELLDVKRRAEFDQHELFQMEKQVAVLQEKRQHEQAALVREQQHVASRAATRSRRTQAQEQSTTHNRYLRYLTMQEHALKHKQRNLADELRQLASLEVHEMKERHLDHRARDLHRQAVASVVSPRKQPEDNQREAVDRHQVRGGVTLDWTPRGT